MDEMTKHGQIGLAAMRAGMDRKTARKYLTDGRMPSEMKQHRDWRTREDPFEQQGERIDQLLREQPAIEAKTLFEILCSEWPDTFVPGQLRTLQRRVERWRATQDDASALAMLAQRHRPGEAAQTDFTHAAELGVSIAGALYAHLLGVFVLPFSNWVWLTICASESLLSIRRTVQRAVFQLGRVPEWHQTDNSTAATHQIKKTDEGSTKRPFNREYLDMMAHFGMKPRTIEVGESHQNGDVEAHNGAIKRALVQALIVRGSAEFESVEHYQRFLDDFARKRNKGRGARVATELDAMKVLDVEALVEFIEERVKVSSWSTISVRKNCYSVPPRLIGQQLRVRVFEDRIQAFFGDRCELECPRVRGEGKRRIDYRHMVWSLVRKPGGFERYVYREEMFPTAAFRRAFEALGATKEGVARDREYLRILHLAASTMESDVEAALSMLLEADEKIAFERVKDLADQRRIPAAPLMTPMRPDLAAYDQLIEAVGT
jgi:hypothetical protein